MNNYFYFNGHVYESGTIVQLREECRQNFHYHSYLIFDTYDSKTQTYNFHSLYNCWDKCQIPARQFNHVIKSVTPSNSFNNQSSYKIEEKYVNGIVSAWIWYILIMLLGLFLKGPDNVILTWVAASVIFFTWRYRQMNGG